MIRQLRSELNIQTPHYSMVIQWSDDDKKFIVSFPAWGSNTLTHGAAHAEAVQSGQEVLADLIDLWREQGRPLPQARVFVSAWRLM